MSYWEYCNYDGICSDYLAPVQGKNLFLHVGAVNTPPEDQSEYVFVETLHLRTDADYIELRTLDFGNHWPPEVWNKHQVVHTNRWAQSWKGPAHLEDGVNTEIVRSIAKAEKEMPSSAILLRFPPEINLLDFNCLLYPGEVLLFTPDKVGCHLYFTFKLYKFTVSPKGPLKTQKKDVLAELQHVKTLLNPVADLFGLIAKIDPSLSSKKRALITQDLDIIDTCIVELMDLLG